MSSKMEITETDDCVVFTFSDDRDICPAREDESHDFHASRPTVKDGPTEDGDWEVIFPLRCVACGITATSEVAAADGFIEYDEDIETP